MRRKTVIQQRPLNPFKRWMVQSNIKTIRDTGVSVTEHVKLLEVNGYPDSAAAVKKECEAPET